MARAASRAQKPTPPPGALSPAPSPDAEFWEAIERYRRQHRRPFPTWCEVLEVARSLGYAKSEPSD
jgi:hypothetical protein